MKKFFLISSGLALFFVGSVSGLAFFTDVDGSNFYYKSINFLDEEDIVNGYPDGSFGYDLNLNRAEMLKIVVNAKYLNLDKRFLNEYGRESCFNDVPAGQWYTNYVCYAKAEGFVNGYPDGTFKPENFITFVEALKIVMSVFGSAYPTTDPWYVGLVDVASADKMMPSTIINVEGLILRSEMADLITRKIKDERGEFEEFFPGERPKETTVNLDYCFDGSQYYSSGDVVYNDSCTRSACVGSELLKTDLCLSTVAEFDDFYEKVLTVSEVDFAYDEYGNGELDFDLSNNSKANLENSNLRIFFQDEESGIVLEYGGAVSVLAGKTSEYEKIELNDEIAKLEKIVSANFYMAGNFFATVEIEPYRQALKFKWFKAGNSYIDFLLDDYELKDGQKFYVRCDSSVDPDAPHFYNGVQTSFQIEKLLPDTDYACSVSLFENDVKSRQSEVLNVKTLE